MVECRVENFSYYYPKKDEPQLKNINILINESDFLLVLGESGSGKSTFAKAIAGIVPEFYGGKVTGTVVGNNNVSIVFQDPEKQLVMDKVEREIAFGLENIGMKLPDMKKRVMEALSFLNIWDIKDRNTYELSGGEKQKVAIGAAIAMGADILILDEPTSQLDPTAAEEILHIIKRLNEDLGYTVILIEQRIDVCFHMADRILFFEKSEIVFDGSKDDFIRYTCKENKKLFIPTIGRYFSNFISKDIPLTIKSGLKKIKLINMTDDLYIKKIDYEKTIIAQIEKANYRYESGDEVLRNITFDVYSKEFLSILGENGSGKTTLLKLISGLYKPLKGRVKVNGKIGYLSQNPNDYLFNDSVEEELRFTLRHNQIEDEKVIDSVLKDLEIDKYRFKNPRDLSGGERQRVALASVLVLKPDILILDEPTRGLDNRLKDRLGNLLVRLKNQGTTIILVTHDIEFVAKYSDRVSLMFNKEMISIGSKYDILGSGLYYSTQMSRLFKKTNNDVLTIEEALCISKIGEIKEMII
jgi:energy-coupling factor transport system ATP-binding protein